MSNREVGVSTLNVHTGKFSAHGEANYLRAEENLLIIHAKGPFNVELVEDLITVEEPLFVEMSKSYPHWYALVLFQESAMAGPEVIARYAAFRKTMTTMRCNPRAMAVVMATDVEGREIMEPLLRKLYLEAGLKYEAFTNEGDARQWLDQISLR